MSVGEGEKRPIKRYRLIVALILAILAVPFVFRQTLLEAVGEKLLQSYGFGAASLLVADFGLSEVQISKIVLDEVLIADNISVGYSFQSLSRGSVDWISVGSLTADVSAPDAGALGTLISFVKNQKSTQKKPTLGPDIKLANGSIFGNYPDRNFKSQFSLNLSPTGIMKGEATFDGAVGDEAAQVKAEGVSLTFDAATHEKTASVTFKNGVLRHEAREPQWAPVTISGNASFKEGALQFLLGAGLGEEIPIMRAEGHYSLNLDVGELILDIQDIAFTREGLQPSNLSQYFDAIPKFDAILSDHSVFKWNKGQVLSESEIGIRELRLDYETISYEVPKAKITLNASYNIKTAKQRGSLVIHDMFATLAKDANKYALNNIKVDLNVENLGEVIKLHNLSASMSHLSNEPNFRPLFLQGKGENKDRDFVFEGDVVDSDKRLNLPFNGHYNGDDKSAFIRGQLHHEKFEKGGFQPKHFSKYFDALEDEITGSSVLAGILAWHPDDGLSIPFLSVNLTQFGYWGRNVQIDDGQLQVKAQNVALGLPVKVLFSNGSANLRVDGRKAKVTEVLAEMLIGEDWKSADLTLSKAKLKSETGFMIKPEIEVSGSSRVTEKNVSFKGQVKTDLLGAFLDWQGQHDIGPNSGSASLKFAEFEFEEEGLQPSDIIQEIVDDFIFTGGFTPELNFDWGRAGIKSAGKVAFNELGVKTDDFDLIGVSGEVVADELQPLVISAPQEITATRLSSAVTMERPRLVFRVASKEGAPVLYVDRFAIEFAGGQALVENAVLNAQANKNQLDVQFSNLDLEKVMGLTEAEAVTASGILNGHIPLVFEDDKIFVELGVLETEGPGILQLKSEQARQALLGGGDQTKLLFDILENFQYSELEIQIKKQAFGDDIVALHTKGANPDVEDSRPVVLNINLSTNLDRIFNTLLDGYRLSEKALRATVKNRKN
ncbi:MAG: YdbH domain-containing protein [Sneathiella sp.]